MFKFIPSQEIKVEIKKSQQSQICSKEKINTYCEKDNVLAFDIYKNDCLIGFAMFRKNPNSLFLWNYAIDKKFQDKHYGEKALVELMLYLKKEMGYRTFVTTYKIGNEKAKHMYEKIGFKETEVILEDKIKEVNMELKL